MASEPENLSEREKQFGEIAFAKLRAQETGERPDPREWLARFPEFGPELASFFADHREMERLAGPLRNGPRIFQTPGSVLPEHGPLGDFRIVREVGRGGMGIVYEAEQISLGRRVALKVLPFAAAMDPRQLQRFHNEARTAASLHHTHIVPVYFVGCERGVHFYAMQFIEGQSLARMIAERRLLAGTRKGLSDSISNLLDAATEEAGVPKPIQPLPEALPPAPPAAPTRPIGGLTTEASLQAPAYFRRMAQLGIQAAEALDQAHQQGILHRDVKPANLLVDPTGRLWVTDFGLAQMRSDPRLTLSGELLGTLRYLSPEQALAQRVIVDHRTDVYALGATLYELLTLEPVFDGTDRQELLRQIALDEPWPLRRWSRAIPAELETIVLKALEKNPADRYATAQEMADDLRHWLEDRPIRAQRPSAWQRLRKWIRRHRVVVGSAAVTLVLALVILTISSLFVWQARDEALQQRDEANRQREVAEAKQATLRRHAYVGDVNLAFQALRRGDFPAMRALVERHVPALGEEDLRGFEWYYLRERCSRSPLTLQRHTRAVVYATFSPRGDRIATASEDGTAGLWDASTGQLLRTLRGHKGDVNWVSFSPDGQTLATASDDRDVKLWDLRSEGEPVTLQGHTEMVVAAVFAPDGRTLASGGEDGFIFLWDVASAKLKERIPSRNRRIEALAYSSDGKLLFAGGDKELVQVVDGQTGRERSPPILEPAGAIVLGICPSPDGRWVAGACKNNVVQIWDLLTGTIQATLKGSRDALQSVSISPDGKLLAACGFEGKILLWELPGGKPLGVFGMHAGGIWCVRFSPHGDRLLTSGRDGNVQVWDVPRLLVADHQTYLRGLPQAGYIAFSSDNRMLWSCRHRDFTMRLLEVSSGRMHFHQPIPQTSFVFLSAENKLLEIASEPDGVQIRDPLQSKEIGRINSHSFPWPIAAFVPDGRRIILGNRPPGPVEVWDLAHNRRERVLTPRFAVRRIAVDPTGRWAAAASEQEGLALWDLTTGAETRLGAPRPVWWVGFSPDGTTLASGDHEGTFELREAGTWQVRATLRNNPDHPTAAFSPDSRTLAISGSAKIVKLWNVTLGLELGQLERPEGILQVPAFSHDGTMLAVTGYPTDQAHGDLLVWTVRRDKNRSP